MLNGQTTLRALLVSLACIAAAVGARVLLQSTGGTAASFVIFTATVLASGWYGGFRAGVLSTVLGLLTGWYLLIDPRFTFVKGDADIVLRFLLFAVVGIGLSTLSSGLRASQIETQNTEKRFRGTFENAAVGMAHVGLDGRWMRVNRRLCEIVGYDRDELLNLTFADITHPDDLETDWAQARAVIAGEQDSYSMEKRYRRRDGTFIWVNLTVSLQRNDDGEPEYFISVVQDISVRRRAEEALRQQGRLLDLSHEPIIAWQPDGVITFWNRGAELLYGWSRDEAVGQVSHELLQTIYTAPLVDVMSMLHEKGSWKGELTHRARNGRLVNVESHQELVSEPGRGPLVLETNRDVTERKKAEVALRESEARFRNLADHAPVMVWVTEADGSCSYLNQKWYEFTGQTEGNALGFGWLEATHPSDMENSKRVFLEANEKREPFHLEYRLRRHDGEWRWALDAAAPRFGSDGAFLGFVGSVIDITTRKQTEEALRQSEASFRELANAVPAFVWVTDADGNLQFFNDRWYAYTGLTPETSLGSGWSAALHPDDAERILNSWLNAREHETYYAVECRYRRADGSYRWFMARALPVRDSIGRVHRWFGTSTDIHEAKQAEGALRKANAELEEFAYVASHDLQEPLRMINIYTQLLLTVIGPVSGDAGEYADFIQQGVRRMEELIGDLLSYSRVIHSDESPARRTDLAASVNQALQTLQGRVAETGATIEIGPLPQVRGETSQYALVFQNLLSNSLKYRKADVVPHVRIWATQDSGAWIVSVRDNGIGFDQQYAERIFGLFKRLHKDEYPGTGLGLAICQRIVDRYDGRIWAEGKPEQGATFHIRLPGA